LLARLEKQENVSILYKAKGDAKKNYTDNTVYETYPYQKNGQIRNQKKRQVTAVLS
jgi:hypothetical protein